MKAQDLPIRTIVITILIIITAVSAILLMYNMAGKGQKSTDLYASLSGQMEESHIEEVKKDADTTGSRETFAKLGEACNGKKCEPPHVCCKKTVYINDILTQDTSECRSKDYCLKRCTTSEQTKTCYEIIS